MTAPMMLTVAAFAVLGAVAVRRGVRLGHPASIWLAVSFVSLAVAGTLAPMDDDVSSPGASYAVLVGMAAGLLAHPVALVEFAHTLWPVRRSARLGLAAAAGLLLVTFAVVGAVEPLAFDDEVPASAVGPLVLGAVSFLWLSTALFVGHRLVRFAHSLTSSVGRARARTMAAGVLTLAPALAIPFLLPGVTEASGVGFALAACLLIWVGYVPPRWLRWMWARTDTRRLAEAELATLRSPAGDLVPWLRVVQRVWDADGVSLELDGQHHVHVGVVPTSSTAAVPDADDDADGVRVERLGRDAWRLVATVAGGRLTVLTKGDPVMFGADAADALLVTASRMRLAEVRGAVEAHVRDEAARRLAAAHRAATEQMRDDVLSTLSHELRTPLVTIRGVPELLLYRWDEISSDEARRLVGRVHHNALTLHRLVESTLLLAQLRAKELEPQLRRWSLLDVAQEAVERLQLVGVDVARVSLAEVGGGHLDTDRALAGAILAELVHNGLTYSDDPASVVVQADLEGRQATFRVVDRGRGLPRMDRTVFLEAFHRAGDLLTRDRRGLGIGLTLANDLAILLDAELTARSGEDGGTIVTLRLPREPLPRDAIRSLRAGFDTVPIGDLDR